MSEEHEPLPDKLQQAHNLTLRSIKKIDLRPSGTWALTAHMTQAADGMALLRDAFKNIMCIIYDLARSDDHDAKVQALTNFVQLQLLSMQCMVDTLVKDIETLDSEFHSKQRKEFTAVLHDLHHAMQEGIPTLEAYKDAVERIVTDPEHKKSLLGGAESTAQTYDDHSEDVLGDILRGMDE